jgi:hypothetical protein
MYAQRKPSTYSWLRGVGENPNIKRLILYPQGGYYEEYFFQYVTRVIG